MRITFLGHAAFKLETGSRIIYIDPWIIENSHSPLKDINEIEKADYVLVTHEHPDHGLEEAIMICQNTDARLVSVFETAKKASSEGVVTVPGNTGGRVELEDGLFIHFTFAVHATAANQPSGYVIESNDGNAYHAGDTALFSDMGLIGEKVRLDAALLPIGDVFTMGPQDAARAAALLDPKYVVPMHYDTFPVLTGTVDELKKHLDKKFKLKALKPGEAFEF